MKNIYDDSPAVKALLKACVAAGGQHTYISGLTASAAPLFFAAVGRGRGETILVVTNDADEAGYFYQDLLNVTAEGVALLFPSAYRRKARYGQRDEANEIERTRAIAALGDGARHVVVTSPEGLAELVATREAVAKHRIELSRGQELSISSLAARLADEGFGRVDYVYEPGQVAVRGGIVDVWSFASELPFRIDFFGDEIDTIRSFEVTDQLSRDRLDAITIVPRLTESAEARRPLTSFLADGSLVVARDEAFLADRIGQIYEEGFSKQALSDRLADSPEIDRAAIEREMRRETTLQSASMFRSEMSRMRLVSYGAQKPKGSNAGTVIQLSTVPQPLFHKNFKLLTETLRQYAEEGYKLYILSESEKQVARLREIIRAEEGKQPNDQTTKRPNDQLRFETLGYTLHEGFIENTLRFCLFTDHQIFDRYHRLALKTDKAREGKMALTMKELQELSVGDYVVHIDFGIARFAGLVRVPVGETEQEMIRLTYEGGDKVDVSIHSLYKISKYRGSSDDGSGPKLSRLGNGSWDRLKERTKKKIKDMARDLIRLYARRRHEEGFRFSPDNYLQHELEASFLYEDTPDQLRATEEVKHDMETARPMDRLVCGDVGFGKTEVAMRAAFKAVCDSKQVAVLVPTTVLAFQHYKSFTKRMEGMPVRVEYLSRARSAKDTTRLLAELAEGRIDILIGTHKLIGKQVKWHDLGLLIIDEEQKFGVAVKEKLRQAKTNIDTLTLSATPIPRTLQFSLMGARDMSIMRTPPPNRHPITTTLARFSGEVIAEAIEFEMARQGQAFVVNPRIANLTEIARLIEKHVPDCRIAIGHGSMPPAELEKVIMGFMNHDYDVLLSTTIVENGIDIPSANTIIINDAHRFGLSDLHQMRGRVGRSNRQAFCYLLSPPLSLLPADARKRLEALETFSGLGSGFSIAMQDLDLRGSGNILGREQSGFMDDLGYETYQKILRQAVTELRNDEFQDLQREQVEEAKTAHKAPPVPPRGGEGLPPTATTHSGNVPSPFGGMEGAWGASFVDDCAVESDLPMFFPETYVPSSAERMLLYRELEKIEDDRDLDAFRQRLTDRFGPVPREGEELMAVVMLRRYGKCLGCEKITLRQHLMQLHLLPDQRSPYYQTEAFHRLIDYATRNPRRCQFRTVKGEPRIVVSNVPTVGEALGILSQIRDL